MKAQTLTYTVATFRDAGLEARWSKQRGGRPIIVARDPQGHSEHQRSRWWEIDADAWACILREGVREGFDSETMLGDVFSI